MTQHKEMPAQFQEDHEDFGALPCNAMVCEILRSLPILSCVEEESIFFCMYSGSSNLIVSPDRHI